MKKIFAISNLMLTCYGKSKHKDTSHHHDPIDRKSNQKKRNYVNGKPKHDRFLSSQPVTCLKLKIVKYFVIAKYLVNVKTTEKL